MCYQLEVLIGLLQRALENADERAQRISEFQQLVWESYVAESTQIDPSILDILHNLAYDLDFYEPNKEWCNESPSFFGDEKFERIIKEAINQIKKFCNCDH